MPFSSVSIIDIEHVNFSWEGAKYLEKHNCNEASFNSVIFDSS